MYNMLQKEAKAVWKMYPQHFEVVLEHHVKWNHLELETKYRLSGPVWWSRWGLLFSNDYFKRGGKKKKKPKILSG